MTAREILKSLCNPLVNPDYQDHVDQALADLRKLVMDKLQGRSFYSWSELEETIADLFGGGSNNATGGK